ncbi:MAG: methyltransferase domain-containing protein [Blastocatellia bacterium]|nr:methyltransferase domain-containing protein [Blastocatellia bacterium]
MESERGGEDILSNKSDKDWIRLGEKDPYFAVLTDDKFRRDNLNEQSLREFFESGEKYVDFIFQTIHSHLDPTFQPRIALDFGCGVGRLVIPLARICDSVTGVDVSPHMLQEARRNCESRGLDNVILAASDDTLANVQGTFDFIHSYIVFQHIPVERGEQIVGGLLERLREDGIGVLHFSYYSDISRISKFLYRLRRASKLFHLLMNIREGSGIDNPLMQINEYDINKLLLLLQEHDCHHSYLRFTAHREVLGVVLFFQRKRPLPAL